MAACSPAGAYQVQREAHEVTQAMRLRVGSCTWGRGVRKLHDTCRRHLALSVLLTQKLNQRKVNAVLLD